MTHHPMNPASVYRRRSLTETQRWFNWLVTHQLGTVAQMWARNRKLRNYVIVEGANA